MSSETLKFISGQLVDSDGNPFRQFPGEIYLFCYRGESSNPETIGIGPVNYNGTFQFQTSIDLKDGAPLTCRIEKNTVNIIETVAYLNGSVLNVVIDEYTYQKLQFTTVVENKCVKGTITLGDRFIAAIPKNIGADGLEYTKTSATQALQPANIKVEICKTLFRNVEVLGHTIIDEYGNYCVHFPLTRLKDSSENSHCCAPDLPKVFVRINALGKIIKKSWSIEPLEDASEVNFHLDDAGYFGFFKTEFEIVVDNISKITDLDFKNFASIVTNPEEENEALSVIYDASQWSHLAIRNVMDAVKISNDYGMAPEHCYLFTKIYGNDVTLWLSHSVEDLKNNISDGVSSHIIPDTDLDYTFDGLKSLYEAALYNQVSSDGYTMGLIIGSIIKDESAINAFLQLNAEFGNLPADRFWSEVAQQLPKEKEALQKGMQVLAINGMQPAMATMMLESMIGDASVSVLAKYTVDEWRNYIEELNAGHRFLQIPSSIVAAATLNGTDPKQDYAQKLFDVTGNIFATTVIKNQLESDNAFSEFFVEQPVEADDVNSLRTHSEKLSSSISLTETQATRKNKAEEVIAFIEANPDFDFRFHNIWEVDTLEAASIRQVVLPLQNIMRLAPSKPQAVVAMLKDGLKSSTDIIEVSQEVFVTKYVQQNLMTAAEADNIYNRAVNVNVATVNYRVQQQSDNIPIYATGNGEPIFTQSGPHFNDAGTPPLLKGPKSGGPVTGVPLGGGTGGNIPLNGLGANPTLQTLFGSMDLCSCSECMSMYSPAAYFTDILNFTKKRLTPEVYEELIRPYRREDLAHIDLTCKNSNTAMPYIDLVNETLEIFILKAKGISLPFKSYQTSGTSKELDAYPEHTYKEGDTYVADELYKEVYTTLDQVAFAPILPFSLALEESRTYFKHLGYSRYDLINKFRPIDSDNINGFPPQLSKIRMLAEWLGLSAAQSGIIFSSYSGADSYFMNMETTINGIPWFDVLSNGEAGKGLNTLLEKSGITYKELLQLLNTSFLNKVDANGQGFLKIQAKIGVPPIMIRPDTCAVTELELTVNPAFAGAAGNTVELVFKRWSRFIRLLRATGWSISQLDTVISSFGIEDISPASFIQIAATHRLSKQLNLLPERLCSVWSGFSIRNYIDYNSDSQNVMPSVYDQLFRNKALINPPDLNFKPLGEIESTATYFTKAGTIIAGFNIKEEELYAILDFFNVADAANVLVDMAMLNNVYSIVQLANGLKYSIADMLRLLKLMNVDALSFNQQAASAGRFETFEGIVKDAGLQPGLLFNLDETEYLLSNKNANGNFIPTDSSIQLFFESLRLEIKKPLDRFNTFAIAGYTTEQAYDLEKSLKNVVVQFFSSQLNIDDRTTRYLLEEMLSVATQNGNKPLLDIMILPEYINALITATSPYLTALVSQNIITASEAEKLIGQPLPVIQQDALGLPLGIESQFNFTEIYKAYRQFIKITFLTRRFKMNKEELAFFFENTDGFVFDAFTGAAPALTFETLLPVAIVDNTQALVRLKTLANLNDWVKVKGKLGLRSDEFIKVLQYSLIPPVPNEYGFVLEWIEAMISLNIWQEGNRDDLRCLLYEDGTTGNTNGALHVNSIHATPPLYSDFKKGSLLLRIIEIMEAIKHIGLSAKLINNALLPVLDLNDSQYVRKAAKAKHSEDEWLKIAKPLQDTLREKQRAALITYILGDAGTFNMLQCKTENELFAHLLIDVEMKPCMRTSRIKQAISSMQLYLDRVILNLEDHVTTSSGIVHLAITPALVEQWRAWRKWYRVWEANRKIFLYPENWIEPELRDDKTPIFKELETQLLQDEVTDDKVEDAYRIYLEQLEEIGRLEPVSAYHEGAGLVTDKTHVFGRTASLPHRYYYRVFENNEWTAWTKIHVDIKSDHITPVMWNGKLYLFWLTFQKKKLSDLELENAKAYVSGNINAVNRNEDSPCWTTVLTTDYLHFGRANSPNSMMHDTALNGYNNWEIVLNWSQFKDDKWLANEFAKDTLNFPIYKAIIEGPALASLNASIAKNTLNWFTKNSDITIDEFFKNRIYLLQTIDGHGNANMLNEDNGITFSIMFTPGLDEVATGLARFRWKGDNHTDPTTAHLTGMANFYDEERGYQLIAPSGTRLHKMKFVEDPYQSRKLNTDPIAFSTSINNKYFSYEANTKIAANGIYRSAAPVTILNSIPNEFGYYKITARGSRNSDSDSHFHMPMIDDFFYGDDRNTYFVRLENVSSPSGQYLRLNDLYVNYDLVQSGNTRRYRFHTFYHAQIKDFIKILNKSGLNGLLKIENQQQADSMNFLGNYQPMGNQVHLTYPRNNVQFEITGAYSGYNWEIFFHSPMLIAQRLSDNQQFEEAQKWYHYVFNPTSSTGITGQTVSGVERFWKFYPFYQQAVLGTPQSLSDLLEDIHNNAATALAQVDKWEKSPFNPHLIARMRILAYMKNVLMKYIDNLIKWGDQLFMRNTIESINEATQLYILAANLLGKRPQEIPARTKAKSQTFAELDMQGLDNLSNAMVNIESFFPPNGPTATGSNNSGGLSVKMFYFCLPKNDVLLAYWDRVADRLFKIRNCMNINGVVQQLPLFEPPIDPALLVRATAMGVDINTVLDSVTGINLPNYRFSYMMQKANEYCGEVRGLGNALLSALEKKDAEQLALIRSTQELNLLDKVKFIKEQQVSDAEAALEAVKLTKENTRIRFNYYSSRQFKNANEDKYLQSIQTGLVLQAVQGGLQTTASGLCMIPEEHIQGVASGPSFGGVNVASAMRATSEAMGIKVVINNAKGSMAATMGGYERRKDDWVFQADTASKELEQLDQQILGAEIKLDIAKKELANHEIQTQNATETDAFMRSKFTNKELYSWMVSQIATTYFQSYQLAYNLAKKTEEAYTNELPVGKIPVGGFIKFGYWDSLRKGLMSGEKLQFDLRNMESTYLDENTRELELTKNFSLAMIDPASLLALRTEGTCNFTLDKTWFDLDFPGHYLRKIKSVSISIPCITGPYTTVAASLTLGSNKLQKEWDEVAVELSNIAVRSIATSSAQNDGGVFELNFRDERYLPFENAGVEDSAWTLNMMKDVTLRQFDYSTINDVIIHIRYTARNSDLKANGTTPDTGTINELKGLLSSGTNGLLLQRYFSLKHEFSNEWYKGFETPDTTIVNGFQMKLDLLREQFPEYANGKTIKVSDIQFVVKPKLSGALYHIGIGNAGLDFDTVNGYGNTFTNQSALNIATDDSRSVLEFVLSKDGIVSLEEKELEDIFFIVNYTLEA